MSEPERFEIEPIQNPLIIVSLFEGGTAVFAVLLGWLFSYPPLPLVVWTWDGLLWGALAGLPVAGLVLGSLHFSIGPLPRLAESIEPLMKTLFGSANWLDLALVSLLAGLGEELLFRGVLQVPIGEWVGGPAGPWVGLIFASALFGMAHAVTRLYAILATLIGLYLGLLWIFSENLLVPITAHAVYDFLALLYLIWKKPD